MTKNRDELPEARPGSNATDRPGLDPDRERLARLIGRLLARRWALERASEQDPARVNPEAIP